jgi:hypothetical protein
MKQTNLRYTWLRETHGIHLRPELTSNLHPKDASVRLQQLHEGLGDKRRIKLLDYREAVLKWPDNPHAKQLLIGALFQLGLEAEGREWIRKSIREHPDNIYLVHTCIKFCETKEDALRLRSVLGPNLSILDFPSGADDTYTFRQFEAYEVSVIDYHVLTHEFPLAKDRLNRLLAFGLTEQALDDQITFLLETSQEYYRGRDALELARRISVTGRRQVVLKGLGKPKLHHPELECLYALLPEDMNETRLKALLQLPRESLISDLRAILRDGLERYDEIVRSDLADEALFFPIHAIRLLGILRATETLPEVLDYLRMEEGFFDFWFGDFADRYILPALYFLSESQLPVLFDYLKEPDIHYFNRAQVEELPAQVLLHQPEREEEVVSLYKDLLEFLLTTDQEGVVDSDFITGLAVPVTFTKSTEELLPAVRELYQRGLIEDSMQGNLEEIERAFAEGASSSEVMALPETPFEFYSLSYVNRQNEALTVEGLLSQAEPSAVDSILARRMKESVFKIKAAKTKPVGKVKVGRNSPCPCGSGWKYKKCCL